MFVNKSDIHSQVNVISSLQDGNKKNTKFSLTFKQIKQEDKSTRRKSDSMESNFLKSTLTRANGMLDISSLSEKENTIKLGNKLQEYSELSTQNKLNSNTSSFSDSHINKIG